MLEKLYNWAPNFIQNLLLSAYNVLSYRKRMGGKYKLYLKQFRKNDSLSLPELEAIQSERTANLVRYAQKNSLYYKKAYANIDINTISDLSDLKKLPILKKENLRASIEEVYTIPKSKGDVAKTGGTTGKSLKVIFTPENTHERFAMLDNFRSKFGYTLGKKTAWFSGKSILTERDIRKDRFWKTDNWYNVRYYSTFHIKENYLNHYIDNLLSFKPEFLVGFPSNMLEIAKYGLRHKLLFPNGIIKAIFPTAETVTKETREVIETFFNTKIYDQYASSEGAPFIFECINNRLHLELQSGIFEVLDSNNEPANSGKLITTSFTTYGTPLIRYDIGDNLELSDEICNCGNNNPLVAKILGREDDFVFSPENGKINLGNVSNAIKGTKGIIKFQVIQNELDKLVLNIVIDDREYNAKSESVFIKNWRDRVGDKMKIETAYVDNIAVEASGKYRIVKNNIKDLIQ